MNDGRKFGWISLVGIAVASSVATLLACAVSGYYGEASRVIRPGIDFPIEWAGREQLGANYESYLSIESLSQSMKLSRMHQDYAAWCAEQGLTPKADQLLSKSE